MGKNRPKRMRRAYLKQYSSGYINTGKGPNKQVMAEYNDRAKSLGVDPRYLDAVFPGTHRTSAERAAVISAKERVMNPATDRVHVNLENGKYNKLVLVFNKTDKCYYFLKKNLIREFMQKSITYRSRDRAMQVFQERTISWIETISLADKDTT